MHGEVSHDIRQKNAIHAKQLRFIIAMDMCIVHVHLYFEYQLYSSLLYIYNIDILSALSDRLCPLYIIKNSENFLNENRFFPFSSQICFRTKDRPFFSNERISSNPTQIFAKKTGLMFQTIKMTDAIYVYHQHEVCYIITQPF